MVEEREFIFKHGSLSVGQNDKATVKLLKKIPIKLGETTDQQGNVINKPKPKSQKKTAEKAETGDRKNVLQSESSGEKI